MNETRAVSFEDRHGRRDVEHSNSSTFNGRPRCDELLRVKTCTITATHSAIKYSLKNGYHQPVGFSAGVLKPTVWPGLDEVVEYEVLLFCIYLVLPL